jgi:hypothetical protein
LLAITPLQCGPLGQILKNILDIKISIVKIKNNKAPREGEVTGDIIRITRSVGMQWMIRVTRNIWQSKEKPDD